MFLALLNCDVFAAAHAHCDIIWVLANTRSHVDVYSFGSSIIALFSYFDDIVRVRTYNFWRRGSTSTLISSWSTCPPWKMSNFGVLREFKAGEEEWMHYVERMRHYFTANDVKSKEKQLSIFPSVCGAHTYKLISSLVAPKKPGDCELDELLKLVSQHKNPSAIVHSPEIQV